MPNTGSFAPLAVRPRTNAFHGAVFDFVPGVGMTVEGVVSDRVSGKALAGVTVRCPVAYDFGWAEVAHRVPTSLGEGGPATAHYGAVERVVVRNELFAAL